MGGGGAGRGRLLLTEGCGNEPVESPYQPGTVSATLAAIIIVFNLNDVASLEHTKYVGVLTYTGALGREGSERRKEGGQGHGREGKNASRSRG